MTEPSIPLPRLSDAHRGELQDGTRLEDVAAAHDARVEQVAEILWNHGERRDPSGDVHPRPGGGAYRSPILWRELLERGLFPADVRDKRAEAAAVVTALFGEAPNAQ